MFGGSDPEVSFQLGQIWPEGGKNQHDRLLRSKLEQKLNMEEVVKMGCFTCIVDGTEILVLKKVYLTSHCHDNLIIIRSVISISTDNFPDYCSYM